MNIRYTLFVLASCSSLVASNLWKEVSNKNFFKQLCTGKKRDRQTCEQLENYYLAFKEAGDSVKASFTAYPLQRKPITKENADEVMENDGELVAKALEKIGVIFQQKNINAESLANTIAEKYGQQIMPELEEVISSSNIALLQSIASTNREFVYLLNVLQDLITKAMQAHQMALQKQSSSLQGSPAKQRGVPSKGSSSGRSMFDGL